MTEREWLVHDSPVALLAHLNADGYSRKLLLYASALGALRPEWLSETLQGWFTAVEGVLAEEAPPNSLDAWQDSGEHECSRLAEQGSLESRAYHSTIYHVIACQWLYDPLELDVNFFTLAAADLVSLRRVAASFVRDIFGNPFRSVSFSPSWRTDTAVALARQMYESREFSAMPILADALQDAGCDNEELLNHCRDTTLTHVRGCWVVDLVLSKS